MNKGYFQVLALVVLSLEGSGSTATKTNNIQALVNLLVRDLVHQVLNCHQNYQSIGHSFH